MKGNVYCLSDLASDILLQQPKLRQLCNSRKLEYIQSEPCLPPDLLVTMSVVYSANTPPGRKSEVPCDVSYLCSLHKRPLWCVLSRERVGLCVCASSQDGVGRSPRVQTHSSLDDQSPSPLLPCPHCAVQTAQHCLSPAFFLPPCNKLKLLSKDNGGTVVLFILQQRQSWQQEYLYHTEALQSLIFINELIFSSYNPFMRVVSWSMFIRQGELRLLMIHGTP